MNYSEKKRETAKYSDKKEEKVIVRPEYTERIESIKHKNLFTELKSVGEIDNL